MQVFLAGLGIFGAESFSAHEGFGWALHTVAIAVFLLALLGPRRAARSAWGSGCSR